MRLKLAGLEDEGWTSVTGKSTGKILCQESIPEPDPEPEPEPEPGEPLNTQLEAEPDALSKPTENTSPKDLKY